MTQNDAYEGFGEARFLRMPDVVRIVRLSRSTIWRLEKRGQFPRRRIIGTRAVGWSSLDIRSWIESRAESQISDN